MGLSHYTHSIYFADFKAYARVHICVQRAIFYLEKKIRHINDNSKTITIKLQEFEFLLHQHIY